MMLMLLSYIKVDHKHAFCSPNITFIDKCKQEKLIKLADEDHLGLRSEEQFQSLFLAY